jgi:hypothetical protein
MMKLPFSKLSALDYRMIEFETMKVLGFNLGSDFQPEDEVLMTVCNVMHLSTLPHETSFKLKEVSLFLTFIMLAEDSTSRYSRNTILASAIYLAAKILEKKRGTGIMPREAFDGLLLDLCINDPSIVIECAKTLYGMTINVSNGPSSLMKSELL